MPRHRDETMTQADSAYRAIFEASSDGLVINDAETGIVLEANPAFCQMHGYDQMIGLHPTSFIHPASHHLFDAYVQAIREGREFRTHAQNVRRDGTVLEVEVLGRGFHYQGRFAMLGVVRDVTEQVRAYQLLEERVAERTRELERRRQIAEGLRDLIAIVNSGRTLDDILSAVLAQADVQLGSVTSAIYLLGEDSQILELRAVHGPHVDRIASRIPVGTPATGLAVRRLIPVAFTDQRAAVAAARRPNAQLDIEHRTSYLNVVRLGRPLNEDDRREVERIAQLARVHAAVLAVPLVVNGKARGTITLFYPEPRVFGDEEVQLSAAFADQAALAIENARLRAQAEERLRELQALYRADATLHRSLQLDDVLEALVGVAADILAADNSAVFVWDAERTALRIGAAMGFPPGTADGVAFARGEGAVGRVAVTGETVVVEDVFADPRVSRRLSEELAIRAGLHVPVTVGDEIFGVFTVGSRRARAFSMNEQRLLLSLAQRAGLAIENARLHGESEHRRSELEALYQADAALHRSLSLSDVLDALVDAAQDLLHADGVGLWGRDPEQRRSIVPLASRGLSTNFLQDSIEINRDPRMRELWTTSETVVSEDGVQDLRFPPRLRAALEREGYRAIISTRVAIGEEVFGTFSVGMRGAHRFSESEKRLLSALSGRAAQAIQNARRHEESEQRRKELQALYEADEALHRSLRLSDVLEALVDSATALLEADVGGLWGLDPRKEGRIVPLASRGLSPEFLAESIRLNDDPGVTEYWWAPAPNVLAVEDILCDPRLPPDQRAALEREGCRSFLSIQVRVGDQQFGRFTIGHREPHRYGEPEQRLMIALGQRAALAIQNARLYEQAQQAATLEERQRLARELHDAVTQTLFTTALIAEVLPDLWGLDSLEGRRQLAELRRLTRGALAEMRTLLVELRPGALTELSLGELLRQLAEASAGRSRLDVVCMVDGDPSPLPAVVQVALYRIAQEALNNVIKHARAEHATVTLRYQTDDGVHLQLSDDGRGFDAALVPPGHFGLGTMRERAEAIGATFRLNSQPERGTTIEVNWHDTEDSTQA